MYYTVLNGSNFVVASYNILHPSGKACMFLRQMIFHLQKKTSLGIVMDYFIQNAEQSLRNAWKGDFSRFLPQYDLQGIQA